MRLICLLLLLPFVGFLSPRIGFAQTYNLISLTKGPNTSIRGMSVLSDKLAWVSGSNGYIGKTVDGGKSWEWIQPAGYEKLDFRDIEAFDSKSDFGKCRFACLCTANK